MMGAALQTVNVRLSPQQVHYTLAQTEAGILLVHRDFLPLIEQMLPTLPHVKSIVALMDGTEEPLPAFVVGEYEALTTMADADFPFRDFDEKAVATTFHTNGTRSEARRVGQEGDSKCRYRWWPYE